MNKKGMELAISTLVIIILGILVLIAIIIAVNGGFKVFDNTTSPFTDMTTTNAIKQTCQDACQQESKIIYCCAEYEIDDNPTNCTDTRLEISCSVSCDGFDCGNEEE